MAMVSAALFATYTYAPFGVMAMPAGAGPAAVFAPSELSDPSELTTNREMSSDPPLATKRNLSSGEIAIAAGDVPVDTLAPIVLSVPTGLAA
jgi:hypothetical protein